MQKIEDKSARLAEAKDRLTGEIALSSSTLHYLLGTIEANLEHPLPGGEFDQAASEWVLDHILKATDVMGAKS